MGQAAAVFYADQYLPIYFEISAKVTAQKPLAGWKANSYVIFDYHSPTDFKWAGINISNDKIEMGYRDASGWHQVAQSTKPVQLKAGITYDVLVAVNGTNVTLTVAGVNWFSYTFTPRIEDGVPVGLNRGMVGVGNDGSKSKVDNFSVQILPPNLSLDYTDNFDGTGRFPMTGTAATGWTVADGRLTGAAGAAVNTFNLGTTLRADSYLELEAKLSTSGIGGIVFDSYGPSDYKFVALDVANDKVLVGHVSAKGGYKVDQSFSRVLDAGVDYTLKLIFKGASTSIQVNGALVGTYGFNAALVDGGFGTMSRVGTSSFDRFQIRTNDPAFNTSANLLAATGDATNAGGEITRGQALSVLDDAIALWTKSGLLDAATLSRLGTIDLEIVDLEGDRLAEAVFGAIRIDRNAAGRAGSSISRRRITRSTAWSTASGRRLPVARPRHASTCSRSCSMKWVTRPGWITLPTIQSAMSWPKRSASASAGCRWPQTSPKRATTRRCSTKSWVCS